MMILDRATIAAALASGQARAFQQEQSIEFKLLGPTLWIEGVAPVIRELDDINWRLFFRGSTRRGIVISRMQRKEGEAWVDDRLDGHTTHILGEAILEALTQEEDAIRADLEAAEPEQHYINSLDREALS